MYSSVKMCQTGTVYIVLPYIIGLGLCVLGANEVTQNEDGTEGSISFTTPTLNDEEAHSLHMPSHLKCDACTAVAYQVFKIVTVFIPCYCKLLVSNLSM